MIPSIISLTITLELIPCSVHSGRELGQRERSPRRPRERERERESAFIGGYANGTWVATAPAASASLPPPLVKSRILLLRRRRRKRQNNIAAEWERERGETRDTDMHTESQLTDRDRLLLLIAAKGREGQGRQRRQFFELAHPHRVSWEGR